jgi:pilus assembly protein FimV
VEHYKGNQYDDDLTVGMDEIADESFDTGYVDLFEYAGDQESPIARLKNLMLSIEWEITDQVLIDFNDELQEAQQTWADDQVKLVYIQALQKITKYIYQKKSNAHHNAMKVLISFFYDLEKIVLDEEISEQQKKEILLADVKKFERLKQQIGIGTRPTVDADEKVAEVDPASEQPGEPSEYRDTNPDLYSLKAYILSIDWEITDSELTEISREVKRLQELWAASKPQKLLLQGIDAVGGYIKLMKSASHPDAFKLLNSFYLTLEEVVDGSLENQQIKELLIGEADKFNRFKEEIAESITPEAIARYREQSKAAEAEGAQASLEPPAEQTETELSLEDTSEFEQTFSAEDIGEDESFSEETLEKVASFFGDVDSEEPPAFTGLSAEEALRGVDVETEADDDSDEEALPMLDEGILAPALADLDNEEAQAGDLDSALPAGVIPGVDVETDEDDDSDEAPLPFADGQIAPALFASDESTVGLAEAAEESPDSEISKHIDDFFAVGDVDIDDAAASEAALSPALSEAEPDEGEESDKHAIGDIEDRLDNFLNEGAETEAEKTVSDESFAALKVNVDSLREEITGAKLAIIDSVLQEMESALFNKPIEKTLTHLIGAVVGSIGKKSGEFDDEAVDLLHSVFGNLEKIRSAEVDQSQALFVLANETAKILQWQQRMLNS